MQKYLGVKLIEAEPFNKDGVAGYNVIYPDGYASWSPKEAFENAYLALEVESAITQKVIESMVATVTATKADPKTVLIKAEMVTGFVEYYTSSCVDPKNYNEQIGMDVAMRKIKDNIWFAMGFVLQWGRYGLKAVNKV